MEGYLCAEWLQHVLEIPLQIVVMLNAILVNVEPLRHVLRQHQPVCRQTGAVREVL